jgi:hypothetical protein
MKKTLLIPMLILLTGMGFTVSASAQDWNCSDLTWSAERLESNPNIASVCLDVVERNGAPYAKLHARIVRQSGSSTVVRYQLPDGGWSASERVFPGGFMASVAGKDVRIRDMVGGQELNVYVNSQGNFTFPPAEPEVAAAPPPPPPPPAPEPEPEPEPEPVYLPTTASQVNLLALLGGLLILMGGLVGVVRTRL